MRSLVERILDDGVSASIVAEPAIRSTIVPLVLGGVGDAVVAEAWSPTAERMGALVRRLEPEIVLHVTVVAREETPSPAAAAFLGLANDDTPYTPFGARSA